MRQPTYDETDLSRLLTAVQFVELFVAEWLEEHLPRRWRLEAQEYTTISREAGLSFAFDLVLYDRETGQAVAVLDTKYKVPDSVGQADFKQVYTYASAKSCSRAYLVYPAPLPGLPFDVSIKSVRVRALTFAVNGDLERAGRDLLAAVLGDVESHAGPVVV